MRRASSAVLPNSKLATVCMNFSWLFTALSTRHLLMRVVATSSLRSSRSLSHPFATSADRTAVTASLSSAVRAATADAAVSQADMLDEEGGLFRCGAGQRLRGRTVAA